MSDDTLNDLPSYALFCTLCVVLNSRCSSQGVDIFGIIGIPKNCKFYALTFISIVKLRIVKQKAQRIAKNHILEIELSNAKLTAQSSGIFWGERFTKSESPTINEYYDQFSSQLIKAIICISFNFQNLLYAIYLIKRACTECTVHKVIYTSFLNPYSNLDFFAL